jgi:hypothetical protein
MATICNHLSLILNPFQYPRSKNDGHDIRNLTYISTFLNALIEDFRLLHLYIITTNHLKCYHATFNLSIDHHKNSWRFPIATRSN